MPLLKNRDRFELQAGCGPSASPHRTRSLANPAPGVRGPILVGIVSVDEIEVVVVAERNHGRANGGIDSAIGKVGDVERGLDQFRK